MNLSDFIGATSSVGVNGLAPFEGTAKKLETSEGTFLCTGYLETDVESYPDAIQRKIGVLTEQSVGSFPASSTTDGSTISNDGVYLTAVAGNAECFAYTYQLSTPWDLSTGTLVNSKEFTSPYSPSGVRFSPDGLTMLVSTHSDSLNTHIYKFTLGTPFYPSTGTLQQSILVGSDAVAVHGFDISPDGTHIISYFTDGTGAYGTLGTAWDLSTFTSVSTFTSLGGRPKYSLDGMSLHCSDREYPLSTPYVVDIEPNFYNKQGVGTNLVYISDTFLVTEENNTHRLYNCQPVVGYPTEKTDASSGFPLYARIK